MKKIMNFSARMGEKAELLKDFPLLFFRLILAYGFYEPAIMKWKNFDNIVKWFGELGIPLPTLNAYLAASTETLGFIFLTLGFATRFISIPLIIVMLVAIKTVHWENGFEVGNNGYEIPLYYMLMLFALFVYGGGKLSLDYLIKRFVK